MTKTSFLAPLAALSLLAAGAAPAFAKAQDEQAAATAGSAGEKKTCKTFQNTASRMKAQKLCLTKAQWKKFNNR